eukprot:6210270-Pleurochrysis_carterae.AAC.4
MMLEAVAVGMGLGIGIGIGIGMGVGVGVGVVMAVAVVLLCTQLHCRLMARAVEAAVCLSQLLNLVVAEHLVGGRQRRGVRQLQLGGERHGAIEQAARLRVVRRLDGDGELGQRLVGRGHEGLVVQA